MKPNTQQAMKQLIEQIREAVPLDMPETQLCSESCRGCSKKMLDYLASELEEWDYRLEQGNIPNFGDLQKLESSGRKIYSILKKDGLL
ncbi:MAG TPA: hypothetical protein DDW45_08225 [Gammaproteobacteria bacterium]|nr:hypothetical protein [Gammaproteobacteria bacterium]